MKKLPQPVERPLTASARGEVLVAAVLDGGCCGWENASSDQALLIENGKVDTRPWITHRTPFDGVIDVFPAYTKPETGVIKAIIEL